MRLNDRYLGFVVNFLLGSAWAFALIGAITLFLFYIHSSFILAIGAFFLGAIPGFLLILFLENIITNKQKHDELKKHTALLEEMNIKNNPYKLDV